MSSATRTARLDNGLKVILREAHAAPVTSTWLWYRVGSRNELAADTGISHWVEHMLFKGSASFPKGEIMRAVDRLGGQVNAMTSHDFTAYYATLPSACANLALQYEADRMISALFDPQEVEAERTVIIAEREGGENEPGYVLAEEVAATAFRLHPYRHQTIGWKEDLLRLTRDQLYAHYRRFYLPSNAVLISVGDFEAERWLDEIAALFGAIPAGSPPDQYAPAEPAQRGERRVMLHMPGAAPIVRISYHGVAVTHRDFMPLVIADAVLSGGKAMFAFGDSPARSARLYRALVETELASSAGSSFHPSLDPYLFTLGATVRQGRRPEEVEAALLAEASRLGQAPVDESELRAAIRQTQAQFAYSSESVTGQALALGFLEMVDRHERMDRVFAELAAVTPEDVLRVAQTYLVEGNRTVGWFVPESAGSGPDADATAGESAPHYWSVRSRGMCAYRPTTEGLGPAAIMRETLPNGIVVLLQRNPASPTVSLGGNLLAGACFEDDAHAGLSSLTASMLRRGTLSRTYQEINVALDAVGASVDIASGRDDLSIGGQALSEDVDLLIDLIAEMLITPSFPEVEFARLRGQRLTRLAVLEMDTGYRSDCAFMGALYPAGHPYARSTVGTAATVNALTTGDLRTFHATYCHPRNLVLSVVGDLDPERILPRLESTLGRWRVDTPAPLWRVPSVDSPPEPVVRRVHIPGRPQVDLVLGVVGMPRTSPDYYPASMANIILGRLGLMGRLGRTVRDEQGLAYYVTSTIHTSRGARPWDVVAGVEASQVDRTVQATLVEIRRMREELVTDAELADCKTYLIGSLPLEMETNEGIVTLLLNIEQYGLGLGYLQHYADIVNSVTRDDIRDVVTRYFPPGRYALAYAGTLDTS